MDALLFREMSRYLPLFAMVSSGDVSSLLNRSSNPLGKCRIPTTYELKAYRLHICVRMIVQTGVKSNLASFCDNFIKY